MYGFSGYGTNAYGSERQTLLAPVVRLAMRTVRNAYNVALPVMVGFGNLAVSNLIAPLSVMLRFRNLTLSNPSQNQLTLEL
jgi:hypothetical protein